MFENSKKFTNSIVIHNALRPTCRVFLIQFFFLSVSCMHQCICACMCVGMYVQCVVCIQMHRRICFCITHKQCNLAKNYNLLLFFKVYRRYKPKTICFCSYCRRFFFFLFSYDCSLMFYLQSNPIARWHFCQGSINSIAFSTDGAYLATVGRDGIPLIRILVI